MITVVDARLGDLKGVGAYLGNREAVRQGRVQRDLRRLARFQGRGKAGYVFRFDRE